MKTNELSGTALDWAVSRAAKVEVQIVDGGLINKSDGDWWQPSADWAQGGEIIERERMSITPRDGYWDALYHDMLFQDDGSDYYQTGTTPLIAAMRCYVASKLGDNVELPEELR